MLIQINWVNKRERGRGRDGGVIDIRDTSVPGVNKENADMGGVVVRVETQVT